jgi:hypothetical protein
VHIASNLLSIDVIMRSRQGAEPTPENYPSYGTWGQSRTPWKLYLFESTNTLVPSAWILELGGHSYSLRQSSELIQDPVTKNWESTEPTWKVRSSDGRWVTSLQSLDDDEITVD